MTEKKTEEKVKKEETKKEELLASETLKQTENIGKLPIREQQKQIQAQEKEKVLQLKEENKEDLEANLMRLQAEFDNYRKRTAKEMDERFEFGKMEFAKSQILFLDEFENAQNHFEGEGKKGILMLLANFKKSLISNGVREMECIGEKYDPYKHEVVMCQESEKEKETIIGVVKKGYYFNDKILRHAQVIISKKE